MINEKKSEKLLTKIKEISLYRFYLFLFTPIYDFFVRMQDRDKVRSSSERQQIKAKSNNAPKSVVLIDSSGKTGCKMSNNSSDSEEDNLYSDVNNAFTLENELSKPDRSETASHVEALKEKVGMGMKCLIDVNSAVEVSLLITDENKIDTETGIGGTVGRSGDSHEESNDCEPAARVRKSLENISIPSWYTKYSENNIIKSKKWTRQKIEVSIYYNYLYKPYVTL